MKIGSSGLKSLPPQKIISSSTVPSGVKSRVSGGKDLAEIGDKIPPERNPIRPQASRRSSRPHPWETRGVNPVTMTGVDKARQAYGLTGEGVTVAVIDSGFDSKMGEPDIWQDFGEGCLKPVDHVGHGSEVAGLVKQVAPKAGIAALKVSQIMVDEKTGEKQDRVADSSIVKALQWTIENSERYNIKVINISLSLDGKRKGFSAVDQALQKAVKAGITVVAIAGNFGPQPDTLTVPGDLPEVLTVGAARDQNHVSSLSGRGGNGKPDLVAPGENLHAPFSHDLIKGTSYAAPVVAGITALMNEARSDISPDQVKRLLTQTASPLDKKYGPEAQGAGMVDAKAALDKLMKDSEKAKNND